MTLKRILTALCLTLTLAPGSVYAQQESQSSKYNPETANDLLELIKDCEDDSCMSYVSGTIGGIAVYSILLESALPFCTSNDVETSDIRDAIVSTIETTPELQGEHPTFAILTAFGRYWPCPTSATAFQATSMEPLLQSQVDTIIGSGGHALFMGNPEADINKTILVFHDVNCIHCQKFRDETIILADRGWNVMVFPVATIAEDSAGYGAVEIALRDLAPDVVRTLHEHNPTGVADITLATDLAEDAGLSSRDILTAIAKSGAYGAIENNTRTFFDIGAEGTPSWIVGTNLYSGFLTADGIETLIASVESQAPAPSPQDQTSPAPMEQQK